MLTPLSCRNRGMASATLQVFALILSFVHVGKSEESLFNLKCQSAVGVIGETTRIPCSFESKTEVVTNTVVLTRIGEKNSCFTFEPFKNRVTGDSRFKVENEPSLLLHNTSISDEGEYQYYIRTNLHSNKVIFTINVTAKYSDPVITSMPKEIVNDGPTELSCNATGGYPAGTIHWFDQSNTNWTKSATLQSMQGSNGLFTLSSKLSFKRFDAIWAPFRCVVLNSKYKEEGGSMSTGQIKDPESPSAVSGTVKNSIAGVIVIGSLIVGLLIALLFKRRRSRRPIPTQPAFDEEEQDLSEPVYKKPVDSEEMITV
ncbi:butyrophilin subfamily 1 member A1 isoform X3 [Neoarius graeffei]|uniref:butyrophilin subfamily 1 member A1 isoform X3 n=1 Tax=Neoarius graeffei TaxID=443677 RepID=UPI00298C493D|nr:butyrophilin subfamily 1 member A1 isoform X3 [Neoarius graeffei]